MVLDLVYHRSTMVYKVVSTKLTEEEHTKFLEFCNKKGNSPSAMIKQSPSAMIKQVILTSMEQEPKNTEELSLSELEKSLLISFFIKISNRRNDTRSFLVNLT